MQRTPASGTIQHVVFVVQENRSFNFMFMGYPGATTQNYGYDTAGNRIPLHAQSMDNEWDIAHDSKAFFAASDGGKMDGWNNEVACCGSIPPNFAYAYARKAQVAPYWALAKSYVLSDQMFQSNLDGSFVAHQYTIAADASHTVDYPTGWWGCPGAGSSTVTTLNNDRTIGPRVSPCLDNRTVGDEAEAAGLTWRSYAGVPTGDGGLWSPFQAIKHIYSGPDWTNDVISPPSQFLTDVAKGTLANITWISPTFANSDHAGIGSNGGPQWVTSVVNAVGKSAYWKTTAIFVMWDDWGGWYDPIPPRYVDYDGLGFRVPLIVIGPYAKRGYVTHVQYETASIVRFIEDTFGLPQLARSDRRAADPMDDVFDFSQKPRKFSSFSAPLPPRRALPARRPFLDGD